MNVRSTHVLKKHAVHSIFVLSILSGFVTAGCTPTPRLTAEDLLKDEWIKQILAGLRTRKG
jgi:hypothetical protein